ncbi:hypothetical protein [Bauldia litoralis]|uniref:hypothetical protein n=1 Tax=Bauldia litoralis TaxID=665467 RepID=UPI003263A20E
MSMITLSSARSITPPHSLVARIEAEGRRRQPLLWGAGLAMLALMVPTYAAYLIDDRLLNGINVWTKPLKFEVSIGLFLATLAWLWGYLPEANRKGRLLNGYAVAATIAATFEIAYMILQAGRGVHSHFNDTTALEGAMYSLMGLGSVTMTSMALVLGIALIRHPRRDLSPAFRLSVVLGLVLTFVLGTAAGIAISANGSHWVAAAASDAGGVPIFGWTREGGDLRVGHFFGMHAMQILPLLGLLVAGNRWGRSAVWLGAAALTALTVATTAQALAGQPFLSFIG